MTINFDAKGKYFTNIIPKEAVKPTGTWPLFDARLESAGFKIKTRNLLSYNFYRNRPYLQTATNQIEFFLNCTDKKVSIWN